LSSAFIPEVPSIRFTGILVGLEAAHESLDSGHPLKSLKRFGALSGITNNGLRPPDRITLFERSRRMKPLKMMAVFAMACAVGCGELQTQDVPKETFDAAPPPTQMTVSCVPGEQNFCLCLDGRQSYQVCAGDGKSFDDCHCDECMPGLQHECVCPGGLAGNQNCAEDGNSYTKCDCTTSDAGVDAQAEATVNAGNDAEVDSEATPDAEVDAQIDAQSDSNVEPDANNNDAQVDSNVEPDAEADADMAAYYCQPWSADPDVFGYVGCCGTFNTSNAIMAGDLIKGSMPAVYYYGSDGKRYTFPSSIELDSWYAPLDSVSVPIHNSNTICNRVIQLTDAQLAAITIGNLQVTKRPGAYITGITSDPKRYVVDTLRTLRWVQPPVSEQIYSGTVADRTYLTMDAFLVNYYMGSDITDASQFDWLQKYSQADIEVELGIKPVTPDNDLCQNVSCPLAKHCEVTSNNHAVCYNNPTPLSFDCELPEIAPDSKTDAFMSKRRFLLPEEGTPNNNDYVGPFCCTGHTAIFTDTSSLRLAFAYFFGWENNAFLQGDKSYVQDVSIGVAASQLSVQTAYDFDSFHFTAEELAGCQTKWLQVGGYVMTARPRHVDIARFLCSNYELVYDMQTLTMAIDIQYVGP